MVNAPSAVSAPSGGDVLALPQRRCFFARGSPIQPNPNLFTPTPHPPHAKLPLWDELWWDDGLKHSQPVLDFTGPEYKSVYSPLQAAGQLFAALGVMVGGVYACKAMWSDDQMLAVRSFFWGGLACWVVALLGGGSGVSGCALRTHAHY